MQLQGFELANTALLMGEAVYNLHDDYDFSGFVLTGDGNELKLGWVNNTGFWLTGGEPCKIIMTISSVSYLNIAQLESDDALLASNGLKCFTLMDDNESDHDLWSFSDAYQGPCCEFQFMSGLVLRVYGGTVSCEVA